VDDSDRGTENRTRAAGNRRSDRHDELRDFGDGKPPLRAFICTPNPWGYPAGDRSGKLEQIEPPDLGKLIAKLTGPGQRKPSSSSPTEQTLKTEEKAHA
jgi:hypothetical protein